MTQTLGSGLLLRESVSGVKLTSRYTVNAWREESPFRHNLPLSVLQLVPKGRNGLSPLQSVSIGIFQGLAQEESPPAALFMHVTTAILQATKLVSAGKIVGR